MNRISYSTGSRKSCFLSERSARLAWGNLLSAFLIFALGIESAQAQSNSQEKPLSLGHLNADEIDVADRAPSLPREVVAIAGTNRGRYWGMIYSFAFSPDGKRIAVGGDKNRVLIFDTATLREIASIQVEADLGIGRIDSIAFAPDGKTLALQAEPLAFAPDGKRITLPHQSLIWLYDLSGREPKVLASLESTDMGHYGCVFSPDGKAFASFGKDSTIQLWDLSSPKPKVKAVFQAKGLLRFFTCLAFAPDGKAVVTGGGPQGTIIWWDMTGDAPRELARRKAEEPGYVVEWLSFTPDGKTLLSVDGDQTVRFWQLAKNEFKQVAKLQVATQSQGLRHIRFPALAADGKTLAFEVSVIEPFELGRTSSFDSQVEIWNLNDNKPRLRKIYKIDHLPQLLALSPDGRVLASGVGPKLQLFDLMADALAPRVRNEAHTMAVSGVAFSPDGKTLATASEDQTLRLWDLTGSKPKEAAVLKGHSGWVTSVDFSPDGKHLASTAGATDNTARLWDLSGGKPRESAVLKPPGKEFDPLAAIPSEGFHSIRFSPDGGILLAVSEDIELKGGQKLEVAAVWVWVWDLKGEKPKQVAKLKSPGSYASVAISPDGKTLTNGRALWDLSNFKERSLDIDFRATELAFSPDGKTLAGFVDDKTLGLVDMSQAKPQLKKSLKAPADPTALAFSRDGKKLAAASWGGKVMVWNTETHGQLHEWKFPGPVRGIAFAPDSRHLATANLNGTAYSSTKVISGSHSSDFAWTLNSRAGNPRGVVIPSPGTGVAT